MTKVEKKERGCEREGGKHSIFHLIIFCLFFKNDSAKHSKIEI
jgi:hypothetical protein